MAIAIDCYASGGGLGGSEMAGSGIGICQVDDWRVAKNAGWPGIGRQDGIKVIERWLESAGGVWVVGGRLGLPELAAGRTVRRGLVVRECKRSCRCCGGRGRGGVWATKHGI